MIKQIFFIIIPLMMLGCTRQPANINANAINVSILPQKFFIEQMVGDRYQVNVVLQDGANHESYEPSPRQMQALEQAGLYLMLCESGFDRVWADHLKQRNPALKIVDLSKGIGLIEGSCEHDSDEHEDNHSIDPHIWVSPSTVGTMVTNIKDALITQFPADSAIIAKGYDSLKIKIDSVDFHYQASLKPFAGKTFMVYHPATSYLARDYNLREMALETDGKEPSVASLKEMIIEARQQQVNLIFMQQEFDRRHAAIVAEETGATIVSFNPMAYDWFLFSNDLLHQLTTHLSRP